MQGGLIDHRAAKECIAVVFRSSGQAPKPVFSLKTQMALEPDSIDLGCLSRCRQHL